MKKYSCKVLLFWLVAFYAHGQSPTDTTTRRLPAAVRDSIRYTKLRTSMQKRRITSGLYDLLFRYPYNTNANREEVSQVEENPFARYEGMVIRNIKIQRLDVFGPSVYDTTRSPNGWAERLGNKLHTETRERLFRNSLLLFKEGDIIHSDIFRDNERVLRQSPLLHDARIIIVPIVGFEHLVDILVITHDVWSLLGDGGYGGKGVFNIALEQRNFSGMGHSVRLGVNRNINAPYQPTELFGRYVIPYLGKSLANAQFNADYLRDYKGFSGSVRRDFLTPDIRWAGAFELGVASANYFLFVENGTDSTTRISGKSIFQNAWLGRAFKLGFNNTRLNNRARLIVALRTAATQFSKIDGLPIGAEALFRTNRVYLASVGFSNRDYTRDVLIYGFGRTEDVPTGYLASFTTGFEQATGRQFPYFAVRIARGSYISERRAGYVYWLANLGGYANKGTFERGSLDLDLAYFSPLVRVRRSSFRQFVNIGFTTGFRRSAFEYLTLNQRDGGLTGLSSNALRGSQRININTQTVCFSPFQVIGFRIAIFGFADIGFLGSPQKKMFSTPYQALGLGLRLRNENLTFNTVQLRLGYYRNIPNLADAFRFDADGTEPLRFTDFRVEAPDRSDVFRTSR